MRKAFLRHHARDLIMHRRRLASLSYVCAATLLVALRANALPAASTPTQDLVVVESKRSYDQLSHTIVVRNQSAGTVTAVVSIDGYNIKSAQRWPAIETLNAQTSAIVGRVQVASSDRPMHFNSTVRYLFGDPRVTPSANYVYALPWRTGEALLVTQAPGGPMTTHATPGDAGAVDFAMPVGTEIHAARAGVVVRVIDGNDEAGTSADMLTRANTVLIQHEDSTVAYYSHLRRGVLVKMGDRVERGDKIAYSGNTGLSSGPHLHFAVKRLEIQAARELQETALAPLFETDRGPTAPQFGKKIGKLASAKEPVLRPPQPLKNSFNWALFWVVLALGTLGAWTIWRRLQRACST